MTSSKWSEAEENAVIELYKRLLAREQDGMAPNVSKSIDNTRLISPHNPDAALEHQCGPGGSGGAPRPMPFPAVELCQADRAVGDRVPTLVGLTSSSTPAPQSTRSPWRSRPRHTPALAVRGRSCWGLNVCGDEVLTPSTSAPCKGSPLRHSSAESTSSPRFRRRW